MKAILVLAFLVAAFSSQAQQSLKDALYGGKLKMDTGTVIRKTEDWKSKIDTSTKKPEPPKTVQTILVRDTVSGALVAVPDSSVNLSSTTAGGGPATVTAPAVTAPRDNNKIWKDYMDSITANVKMEVMPNKKIKDGAYSVLIEYEIGLQGQVDIMNVTCSPENTFLANQIKERLMLTAPQLNPLLSTTGKPRKALKKQMMTLSK